MSAHAQALAAFEAELLMFRAFVGYHALLRRLA